MQEPMLHRLPVSAYTSAEWFAREQACIFSRTWAFAGLTEDISEPGQHLTVQAGLNNLLIVMGPDHRLRAFHNQCRHRGTQLIRVVGKARKLLTCPYHDWSYDLEGRLIAVPEEREEYPDGLDKSCLGLLPASVACWRGMLFVHPDPKAPSIDAWFGPIEGQLGPHQVETLVEADSARQVHEIAANWKIVVENFIDVYHLRHLHAGTLRMYDHRRAEYGFVGPHFAFWEPPSTDYADDQANKLPSPRIIPEGQSGAWVPMLFPGIGLAQTESDWSTFIVRPVSAALTRVEIRSKVADASRWAFASQALRSASYWAGYGRGKYQHLGTADADDPMASGDFMAEDIYACEQQQRALQSPHFCTAPASRGEAPVLQHQQIVLDYLAGDGTAG